MDRLVGRFGPAGMVDYDKSTTTERDILEKLFAYEDTGFTPSDIADHEEMFKAYRHICGGLSPEEVAKKINEASALKNDIADLRNFACQLCGKYKTAHKGACDGCRWKKGARE